MASSGSSYRPMCGVISGSRWSPENSRPWPRRVGPGAPPPGGGRRGRGCGPGSRSRAAGGRAGRGVRRGRSRGRGGRARSPGRVRAAAARAARSGAMCSSGAPAAVQLGRHVVEPAVGAGLAGAPDDRRVGGVHRDPGPGRLPHLAGQAVVVGVVVGDDHAVDLGDGGAAGGEPRGEGVPGGRVVPAGVDEHRAAVGVDDVHEGVAERVVRDGHLERTGRHRRGRVTLRHALSISLRPTIATITRTGSNGDPSRLSAGREVGARSGRDVMPHSRRHCISRLRREVRGVDDLGLGVQPGAGRLGVGLEVLEAERGGAEDGVPLDAPAEGVLVGVEDEVPYRDGVLGEARADLAPVLLDQDGHRHHQGAAGVVEYAAGGLDDERPPRRPVLEVVRLGQPRRDVHECLADLLGVEHP